MALYKSSIIIIISILNNFQRSNFRGYYSGLALIPLQSGDESGKTNGNELGLRI